MALDRFTVALLLGNPDAPRLDDDDASAMQDTHMAHLADLHEAGALLAAGPVLGPADRRLRGLSILRVDPEEARRLKERDPSVRAGLYIIETYPWLVPAGAMSFSRVRFPRAVKDVTG
jgi:uncharacterized protein